MTPSDEGDLTACLTIARAMGWEFRKMDGMTFMRPPGSTIWDIAARLPRPDRDPAECKAVREFMRQQGWLVVLKALPDDFPWRGEDDEEIKTDRRFLCELSWMPLDTPKDTRMRLYARPWAFGATEEIATVKACAIAVEEMARFQEEEKQAATRAVAAAIRAREEGQDSE